jgi:hypothetical protein
VGVLCFLLAGCAAPRRTFVSNSEAFPRKTIASETAKLPESIPPAAEPNPKPSVWSKWMGSLTPGGGHQAEVPPPERIPLPRTDGVPQNFDEAHERMTNAVPF